MPELKTFAIAYLLDEGVAIEKIKRKLVHPDRPMAGGATLSGGAVKDAIIEEAQEWRSDI